MSGKAKGEYARSRSESEPEQGAESDGADAKPSDLRMVRLKSRNTGWRAARISVEKLPDELCVGVKGQSNLEIARTPRKAFRCRVGCSPRECRATGAKEPGN